MFCQYQYYRRGTKELQTAVDHSDENYKCRETSRRRICPYIGTTVIEKISWGDWPADEPDPDQSEDSDWESDSSSQHSVATESEAGDTQEEDQAEKSDTNREEDREEEIISEEPAAQEMEENVEMARADWPDAQEVNSEVDRRDRSGCLDVRNCCNIL